MSGPASGVMAAAAIARAVGVPQVITYDMGGTSSDVGLIQGGVPQVTSEIGTGTQSRRTPAPAIAT